jgi:hypothetical protein
VAFEFACLNGGVGIFNKLAQARYSYAKDVEKNGSYVWFKHYLEPAKQNSSLFWADIKKYGVEHRSPINETPLMRAVRAGSVENVKKLLDLGANLNAVDTYGSTAFQKGLRDLVLLPSFAKDLAKNQGEILPLVRPESRRIKLLNRLIKLDASSMEYFVLNLLTAAYPDLLVSQYQDFGSNCITAALCENLFKIFHGRILPDHRKKRTYINGVLAKSEVFSSNQYSRQILLRIRKGQYIINPLLEIEMNDQWVPYSECFGLKSLPPFVRPEVAQALAYYERIFAPKLTEHLRSVQK